MHGLVFHGLIGLKCNRCKFFSKYGHCLSECSCYCSPMFRFCTAFKWSAQERLNENDSSKQYSWKHRTVLNLNQPVIHKLSVKMWWIRWSHFRKGSLITKNHIRKGYSPASYQVVSKSCQIILPYDVLEHSIEVPLCNKSFHIFIWRGLRENSCSYPILTLLSNNPPPLKCLLITTWFFSRLEQQWLCC